MTNRVVGLFFSKIPRTLVHETRLKKRRSICEQKKRGKREEKRRERERERDARTDNHDRNQSRRRRDDGRTVIFRFIFINPA